VTEERLEVRAHERISEIAESSWDALLAPDSSPFVEWAWLDALERAGCVSPQRGWAPRHMTVWRGDRLVAAVPAYLKGNSEGEFVFDWSWASVAERLGVEYYPKLVAAVPFTPATGDRVLIAPGEDPTRLRALVADALAVVAEKLSTSSAHVLFPREDEAAAFAERGWALRHGVQFHWRNRGYRTYDDFLATFDAKRRHQLRRERRVLRERGIVVETRRGPEIDDATLAHAYRFYLATVDKFVWGRRYLNEKFFHLARERFATARDDLLHPKRTSIEVVLARQGDRVLGGAFNVAKAGRLYGRYWGADVDVPFLHFEVCYYHSIEQCIERGFDAFEPGAGGEHKARRGFAPTITRSLHRIHDRRLDRIVREFLPRERAHVEAIVRGEIDDEG
jgi:predicted N-acyltransferase